MGRFLILGLALLLCGCATTDFVTGQRTNNFYSLDEDIALGRDVFEQIEKEMQDQRVPKNADLKQLVKLKTMVRRIAQAADLPDLPYEVVLYSTNIVNAMAAPGGHVIVFEGLWDEKDGLVRGDDELAAVLAHEIAHVNCRHSTEAMTRQLLPAAVLTAGLIYAGDNGRMQALLGGTFLAYQGLVVTHYSRRDEFEADRVGMHYMALAGYDPQAALRIWKRAASRDKATVSPLSIFATHPSDAARLRALEEELPAALRQYEQAIRPAVSGE